MLLIYQECEKNNKQQVYEILKFDLCFICSSIDLGV